MALQSTTLYGMLHERMDWLSQRQRVLSQNVANADTSGYKAQDLKPLDFRKTLQNAQNHVSLERTHVDHRMGSEDSSEYGIIKPRVAFETTISGNTVVLEDQMSKVAANTADYQLASRIFSKYKKMHSLALTGKL